MTMTSPKPSHEGQSMARTASISWTIVQAGLWVGKRNGEFAGMIETRLGEGFSAMRLGTPLGIFATVDEAKASFAE